MVGGRARRRAKMRRKESVSSGGNSFGRENEELSVSRRVDARPGIVLAGLALVPRMT